MKFILLLCAFAAVAFAVENVDTEALVNFSVEDGGLDDKVVDGAARSASITAAKLQQQLGPAYVALVRALGTRTTAYVNNYARAAGLVATVKFFRQTFSTLGSANFVSFWRQYAALLGGAGGFQLNAIIQAYGRANLNAAISCISAIYQELGADALRLYQSILLATGGRSSIRAARILNAFTTESGDCTTAGTDLNTLLAATGSTNTLNTQARDFGIIIGVLNNRLGLDIVRFAARNPTDIATILTAARNLDVAGDFDFTTLTTYNPTRVAQLIAQTISDNDIDITA